MIVFRSVIGLLGLLWLNSAYSQNSCTLNLSGQVIDHHSGKGLPFAGLLIKELNYGQMADSAGFFKMENICKGSYTLLISHLGCEPKELEIELYANKKLEIMLEHREHLLDEIVIREEQDQEAFRLQYLQKADLVQASGLQIAEQAALMPGMRILRTGNTIAKPVYRGMHSNRLPLINNGIRQEGQYWGSEHAPEVDAYIADELAVVDGVATLAYASDAIAGLLLLQPPDVFASDSISGTAITALQTNGRGGSAGADIKGRLNKMPLYFRVQGSAKKLGDISTPDVILTNTGAEEYNYSYALGYAASKWRAKVFYSNFNQEIGIYRYSHLGNLTDLYEVLQGRPQPDTSAFSYEINRPRQRIGHELFKSSLKIDLNKGRGLEAVYARQFNLREEFDVHVGRNPSAEALKQPQLDYALTTHLAQLNWNHNLFGENGKAGVSGMWRRNNFTGRNFMPDYTSRSYGIFFTERFSPGSWLLDYGLRYDHTVYFVERGSFEGLFEEEKNFQGFAGAIRAARALGGGELKIDMAALWRPPAVNELYTTGLHHGVGAIEEGNPFLKSERAYKFSVGYKRELTSGLILAEGYVNYIDDFIYADPTTIELSIRGAFPRFDYRQDDALFYGFDMEYTAELTKRLTSVFTANLVWAENIDENSFFQGIPAHRFENKFKYRITSAHLPMEIYAAMNLEYTMQQYRAPEVFPFETVFGSSDTPLPQSFDFAPPPEGYFLAGLEAGLKWPRFQTILTATNIFNTTYRDYLNRFRYYADEMGKNLTLRMIYNF